MWLLVQTFFASILEILRKKSKSEQQLRYINSQKSELWHVIKKFGDKKSEFWDFKTEFWEKVRTAKYKLGIVSKKSQFISYNSDFFLKLSKLWDKKSQLPFLFHFIP